MQELVARGQSLHVRNIYDVGILIHSVGNGCIDIVKWLIDEQGFDIKERRPGGYTLLHSAAAFSQYDMFLFLLTRGLSLHSTTNEGVSVLHNAAKSGCLRILGYLLSEGFTVNDCTNDDDTPLHIAAFYGHLPLVQFLIDNGAGIHYSNIHGITPLLSAINGKHLATVQWLLTRTPFWATTSDNNFNTVLHYAAYVGCLDILQYLVECGADTKVTSSDGVTICMAAAQAGHSHIVDWLLRNGASLTRTDVNGMTLLFYVALSDSIPTLEIILQHMSECNPSCGFHINTQSGSGKTPLYIAAENGNLPMVRALMAHGAHTYKSTATGIFGIPLVLIPSHCIQDYSDLVHQWSPLQIAVDARLITRARALIVSGEPLHTEPSLSQLACSTTDYDGALAPTADMKQLIDQALKPWSPSRHTLFPTQYRKDVFHLFMFRMWYEKIHTAIPTEIWEHIATLFNRDVSCAVTLPNYVDTLS